MITRTEHSAGSGAAGRDRGPGPRAGTAAGAGRPLAGQWGVAERVLITIRVHPGASRARVGGWHAEPGHERVLGVWVMQRAVDGKATQAALDALADRLGVRRRTVRLVTGARARVKVVEICDPPANLAERLRDAP
ncbi:MAG TPA: DUF167 domain-containing protein [Streptosporangiaceae bacterium]|nr:DUF167 domain-containing protein [Streptosporangiaceae bacterium]